MVEGRSEEELFLTTPQEATKGIFQQSSPSNEHDRDGEKAQRNADATDVGDVATQRTPHHVQINEILSPRLDSAKKRYTVRSEVQ
jgi:hypothetical protein